mgnify:CR=1 FL=1
MRGNMKKGENFARRTEEALKRYDKGTFTEMDFDDFMEEAKTW